VQVAAAAAAAAAAVTAQPKPFQERLELQVCILVFFIDNIKLLDEPHFDAGGKRSLDHFRAEGGDHFTAEGKGAQLGASS